jgi:hypothetical protein
MVQSLSGAAILLPSLHSTIWLNDGMLLAASYTSSLAHMWHCMSALLSCFYRTISELPLLSDTPTYMHLWNTLLIFIISLVEMCVYLNYVSSITDSIAPRYHTSWSQKLLYLVRVELPVMALKNAVI